MTTRIPRPATRRPILGISLVLGLGLLAALAPTAMGGEDFRVLVFTRTEGFRHSSIADGIALVQSLGAAHDFGVDTTEDPADFTTENLEPYAAVIWLSTTGDVLDAPEQEAFEDYIRAGGGYVGVHASADTEYGWPWYGQLLGGNAWFLSHPSIQTATLDVEENTHVSTEHYPPSFSFRDEWYNFQNNPRPSVSVLLTIDETSYNPGSGAMGDDHPISWYHEFDGGRSWYTAMGHRTETFEDPDFQLHLLGGILWAAACEAGCGVPAPGGSWATTVLLAIVLLTAGVYLVRRR